MRKIVLASASPRRRELLTSAGVIFQVCAADSEEKITSDIPEEIFPLIRQLKELGILFVAASGRQYANMKKMFVPVEKDVAFICENGGLAVYNERVLHQGVFDPGLVREIMESIYAKEGAEYTCSTKDFY